MKRVIQRTVFFVGFFALMAALATPSAEAGGRHRYRATVHRHVRGAAYHARYAYFPHRELYRVRVHTPPVVVVPVVPVAPVPYYGYYRGPGNYLYYRGW